MKRRNGALLLLFLAASLLVVVSCVGGLPPSVQREINSEKANLASAEQTIQHSQTVLKQDLAEAPDLFEGVSEATQWTADVNAAATKIVAAKRAEQDLLHTRDEGQARRLLAKERMLRESAVTTAKTAEGSAAKWLAFRKNLPESLAAMNREYQAIHNVDLSAITKTIADAEKDWPAKAGYLDGRVSALRTLPQSADSEWASIATARQNAAAGKASGKEVATLIQAEAVLAQQAQAVTAAPVELAGLCGQLYDGWDKILTDLDESHYGGDSIYRERLKIVRVHYTDVAAKKTETHSEEHWTSVPEASFHAVEKDIGMAIAHKDAGHFDSEAQTVPQPPGYSYIAAPEVGSNQYGRWTNDSYGHSVWTWLPEYLILRELLWNHSYQPVVMGDYSAYRMAQQRGTSYYGQRTPEAPPKFGTHGTFTESHYAGSRYMQSGGGYRGSAYASSGGAAPARSTPSFGNSNSSNGAGKRFGKQAGSPPMGQRFGRPSGGGFRPSGRGFGRRR
jgi:hypothetical protein